MDEAFAAVSGGNLALAERLSRRAIAAGQVNPRLWLDHGRILDLCGHDDEAGEAVRQAIVLAPRYAEAFAELAAMQARRAKLPAAVRLQRRAVELDPEDPRLREALASLEALLPQVEVLRDEGESPFAFTDRTERFDWAAIDAELQQFGVAKLTGLLDVGECARLVELWEDASCFEHEVVVDGEPPGGLTYRFFTRPFPEVVSAVRTEVYERLAPIANEWQERLHRAERFPERLVTFLAHCSDQGQTRPTPILLRYAPGCGNPPHRDIAGKVVFPFQLAVTLGPSCTAVEGGGELRLIDARHGKRTREKRMGTGLGDGIVFCARERLVRIAGAVGLQPVFHGLSEVGPGVRFALGLPFHDHR